MATTASIPVLLRYYAQRQDSELIKFSEFCEYIRRYAEHHISEQPDLTAYIENAEELVYEEAQKLAEDGRIFLAGTRPDLKIIMCEITAEKIAAKYAQIISNPQCLFPSLSDLPKYYSYTAIPQQTAPGFFFDLLDQKKIEDRALFSVTWQQNVPAILYPAALSVETLLEAAVMKMQAMLQKEDIRDFYLKKLVIANAGREVSAKSFFNNFMRRPRESLEQLKQNGDAYYLWNQLCFYIKQDFEKIKDATPDDSSKLQAIYIIEYVSTYYKNKAQANVQRETALRTLDQTLERPPYYFSYHTITLFVDGKNIPLLGQYSEEELVQYLQDRSTTPQDGKLPRLLTFKIDSGTRYYISKSNVMLLITRLLADARETIRSDIIARWKNSLKNYNTLPEMRDPATFEKFLDKILQTVSPVLYALFNAPFLELVNHEEQSAKNTTGAAGSFFKNGELVPYTEILLLSRIELLGDAKLHLPFWYVTPPFSAILRLFFGQPKKKTPKRQKTQKVYTEPSEVADFDRPSTIAKDSAGKRKEEIRAAAEKLTARYVPTGSTLDRELAAYERCWNFLLDKNARQNLTEDVNSIIRDYLRKVIKTLRGPTIDAERIHNLAATLSSSQELKKITAHEQLFMYIQLYIIRLLSNIK